MRSESKTDEDERPPGILYVSRKGATKESAFESSYRNGVLGWVKLIGRNCDFAIEWNEARQQPRRERACKDQMILIRWHILIGRKVHIWYSRWHSDVHIQHRRPYRCSLRVRIIGCMLPDFKWANIHSPIILFHKIFIIANFRMKYFSLDKSKHTEFCIRIPRYVGIVWSTNGTNDKGKGIPSIIMKMKNGKRYICIFVWIECKRASTADQTTLTHSWMWNTILAALILLFQIIRNSVHGGLFFIRLYLFWEWWPPEQKKKKMPK